MKRLLMAGLFLTIAAAGYGAWWWSQQGGANASVSKSGKAAKGARGKGSGILVVRATRAMAKPMPELIEAVGTVEPEHSVQVRAQVSGLLQSVQFKEGDKVKAGQLLFQIDPRMYEASFRQAQAQLARDLAQLENAKVQQERLEPLLKREFITRQEFDLAVTSTKSLEATVAADRALLEQARI
jgi:membrane fusion protein, multidrug efflux system